MYDSLHQQHFTEQQASKISIAADTTGGHSLHSRQSLDSNEDDTNHREGMHKSCKVTRRGLGHFALRRSPVSKQSWTQVQPNSPAH